VEVVEGDMLRPDTLKAALEGVERLLMISSSDERMWKRNARLLTPASRPVSITSSGSREKNRVSVSIAQSFVSHVCTKKSSATSKDPSLRGRIYDPGSSQVYFREVPTIVSDGAFYLPINGAKLAPVDRVACASARSSIFPR
jgi:hypothetical protein